jgi:hypothetical protein
MLAADGNGGTDTAGGAVPVWLPWALVGVGLVLLCGVIVLLVRGRTAAATPARPQAGAELAELQNSLVEVKKLAASVADDLDRRAERLERLIAQADDLIERGTGETPEASAQKGSRDGGRGLRQTSGSPPAVDDLAQRVFALADQGGTAQQIAQALRQPIGNIELMLALRGER